jgi:hypothetical protein
MNELTWNEMQSVVGGSVVESVQSGFNFGTAVGTVLGAAGTGTVIGAARYGLIGGAIGFAWGTGWGIGKGISKFINQN